MTDEVQKASPDALYTQACAELRACRDHEFMVSVWFTALLLAMLGAVVGNKYAAAGSPLGVALERCPSLTVCLAILPVLLSLFGAWSIADAMGRHGRLRKWVADTLEPGRRQGLQGQQGRQGKKDRQERISRPWSP